MSPPSIIRESVRRTAPDEDNRLSSILDALPTGILAYGPDGKVTACNATARQLLGVPDSDSALGLSHEKLGALLAQHCSDPASAQAALRPLDGTSAQPVELQLGEPRRWVRAARYPTRDQSGRVVGCVVLLEDLAELKQEQSAIQEHLMLVAHDLKTPLTNIKAYAQLAALRLRQMSGWPSGRDGELVQVSLEHLGTVNEQADRLTKLISELLELGRRRR